MTPHDAWIVFGVGAGLAAVGGVLFAAGSRRLADAREQVLKETRRLLQERLGLSQLELQSFMKPIDSQFDVRISQLFGEEDALSRKG